MSIWSSEIKELEKLYKSFKGHLPELEKELERLVKADDENMILLYSRRCLEVGGSQHRPFLNNILNLLLNLIAT